MLKVIINKIRISPLFSLPHNNKEHLKDNMLKYLKLSKTFQKIP